MGNSECCNFFNTTTHNRLRYVDDGVNAANYAEDIDDQASGNYNYDRIGNLILDVKEKISNIEWTVYGKIRKITKNDAAGTVIEYEYDASGNRIYKKVSANNITSYTFYVRDAQGNTLAVYTKEGQDPIKWSEQHLYGSSRIGMVNLNITVPANVSWPTPGNTLQDGFDYGKTVYELSNHLGNVLATITDQKDAVQNGSTGVVGYYKAVSMTQTDYYPGGMIMVGRFLNVIDYRYTLNGQEKTPEINENATTAEFWQYDSRIVRRWNYDPRPNTSISPYNCFAGNPIIYSDIKGDSISPTRTRAVHIFVVPIEKDAALERDYSRLVETKNKSDVPTFFMHAEYLGSDVADKIIKRLGNDGYIATLVIDFHRSEYDNFDQKKVDEFYETLSKGYAGDKTSVMLGMCWAGGGPTTKEPDLTLNISKRLDKATVFGLKTEAASMSFKKTGNFGTYNPAYMFDFGVYGENERKYQSVWTISSYDSKLNKYTSVQVHEMIILNLKGMIIRIPIVPPKDPAAGTVKYEHGRIM